MTQPTPWSPETYLLFEAERTRPVNDLLSIIPEGAAIRSAADLGCGPGNSTEILAKKFPNALVTGIDSSAEMLHAARQRLPNLTFEQADIETWTPAAKPDLILANASLQWVPGHATLFPHLLDQLEPGGMLAIQMPDNQADPTHRLMREIAANGPWSEKLAGAENARTEIAPADWYFSLLQSRGARPKIWRTTYYQPLAGGVAAIVAWFRSTGLRPFLAPLDHTEQEIYLARYQEELKTHYPELPSGEVLLPSPRLFIVATLSTTES
jgi:trans-aconitate 2-methyltransferase